MEIVLEEADLAGFERTNLKLSKPLVFHCVPGAGKSTFIRHLLGLSSRFEAFTHGAADPRKLDGRRIKPVSELEAADQNSLVLIDEYCSGEEVSERALAVFGDPLQSNTGPVLQPHFVLNKSRRFGAQTAALLKTLGYDVEAEGDDNVKISDIFKAEPEGKVICYEREVAQLLRRHGVDYLCANSVRGSTFDEVCFVTAESEPSDRALAFVCLTRHRKKLQILCPNATYAPA
ncbi:triple gene block protein 1 [Elderberry carlavirus C]|uniref:Triple gene block protein 1 n=1 Tax=Elderberry carlavirus C TaxID=1569054 RepID=A0A0A7M9C3_9VIRU|nr:triple gene block protein 1 [Elderberry carlavirus C]AIZ76626.1 triple gene block protein 1 [Elderberry carlavirus C]